MTRLPNGGKGHCVWIDNLFTSSKLLSTLRQRGIAGAGTVRTQKTKREENAELEESEPEAVRGPRRPSKEKERQFGMNPLLMDLKTKYSNQVPWGKTYCSLSNDKMVLQMAWKDSQVVLFMSTI
jgi:hypothetical protein